MTEIFFSLPIRPVPESRQRFDPRTCRTYQANKRLIAYKDAVHLAIRTIYPAHVPFTEAVKCEMKFFFAPPKRKHKNFNFCPIHGDLDNLAKAVMDAMNRIVYVDDRQIVSLSLKKYWGIENEDSILVKVAPATENDL